MRQPEMEAERPDHSPLPGPIAAARARMHRVFTPNQVLGRTQPIGCTAVEITQRCNLDCTLCYLSEHSESVRDLPIEAVFARLDAIRASYGPRVHVQITGGEPTLRKHAELIAIVRHARSLGLYPALFTNGIAASRSVLEQLADAGLCDVAFHVDTTQRRKGCDGEASLNAVREEYMARARGLGLMVIFNTTVHQGNVHEIPALLRFFISRSDRMRFASFQLQAETGRGEWGARAPLVSVAGIRKAIESVAGTTMPWEAVRIGHPDCHSYLPTLVAGGRLIPVVEDARLFAALLRDFGPSRVDRHMPLPRMLAGCIGMALQRPDWIPRLLASAGRLAWRHRQALLAARGRVHRMSFFIHNFMDAAQLDPERVEACSFMVITDDGPVSMCEHNARRNEIILKPITVTRRDGSRFRFDPLDRPAGRQPASPSHKTPETLSP